MLQEIFKGMDNAAEQINENFQKVNIQTGENENGVWRRYGDGYQECSLMVEVENFAMGTEVGAGLYRSNAQNWDFPMPFSEPPLVMVSANLNWRGWGSLAGDITPESAGYIGIYPFNTTVPGGYFVLTAKGRWKE